MSTPPITAPRRTETQIARLSADTMAECRAANARVTAAAKAEAERTGNRVALNDLRAAEEYARGEREPLTPGF